MSRALAKLTYTEWEAICSGAIAGNEFRPPVRLPRDAFKSLCEYLGEHEGKWNGNAFVFPKPAGPLIERIRFSSGHTALAKSRWVSLPNILHQIPVLFRPGVALGMGMFSRGGLTLSVSVSDSWTHIDGYDWVTDAGQFSGVESLIAVPAPAWSSVPFGLTSLLTCPDLSCGMLFVVPTWLFWMRSAAYYQFLIALMGRGVTATLVEKDDRGESIPPVLVLQVGRR